MLSDESDDKKLNINEATKLVHQMLGADTSCLIFSRHCEKRMKEREISPRDVINVLLGGRCAGSEPHSKSGLWVYRFETNNYRVECNVFRFKNIVVITVIRKKKGA